MGGTYLGRCFFGIELVLGWCIFGGGAYQRVVTSQLPISQELLFWYPDFRTIKQPGESILLPELDSTSLQGVYSFIHAFCCTIKLISYIKCKIFLRISANWLNYFYAGKEWLFYQTRRQESNHFLKLPHWIFKQANEQKTHKQNKTKLHNTSIHVVSIYQGDLYLLGSALSHRSLVHLQSLPKYPWLKTTWISFF